MTRGQQQAFRELQQLLAAGSGDFELESEPFAEHEWLLVDISIRIGPTETRPGGLRFRERERFRLALPPDYPFECPVLLVGHKRFAGFPHVTWSRALCLYQSRLEWDPRDGLYGFFSRLSVWLSHAALNDMDPVEGPLEPPHHVTNYKHLPIVVRTTPPADTGVAWSGFAKLTSFTNRLEIDGWRELDTELVDHERLAPAIFLARMLPQEFPEKGADFLAELEKHNISRELLLRMWCVAAVLAPEGDEACFVLGTPMRRTPVGAPAHHIAVWAVDSDRARQLRLTLPKRKDSESLRLQRIELAQAIQDVFVASQLSWCPILEDRPEIIAPRDSSTPLAWFAGKKVLLLGSGALGSWIGEMIVRSNVRALHVVDQGIVKPGLLVRQNFVLDDIGSNKAEALVRRLRLLRRDVELRAHGCEAYSFLVGQLDTLSDYDLILDCTASSTLQMRVERDWSSLGPLIQRMSSCILDAAAEHFLLVSTSRRTVGGPWTMFLHLKHRICTMNESSILRDAFYAESQVKRLFQPEPGCSDPTFRGSSADVMRIASCALNKVASWASTEAPNELVACVGPSALSPMAFATSAVPPSRLVTVDSYRILLSPRALNEVSASVKQNARLRSKEHETGGLLWGYWDEASAVIIVFDASGPPPDSRHERAHFECGVDGTRDEHQRRTHRSCGTSTFLGFWHTHPGHPSKQSAEDVQAMSTLVARVGGNKRRALMMIFGRNDGRASAGIFIYESQSVGTRTSTELVLTHEAQVAIDEGFS